MITNLAIGHNGRLGNQIFQYAILKCISLKNNYEIVLPLENSKIIIDGRFNPSINKVDRYKLDLFDCFELYEKIDTIKSIIHNVRYKYAESFTMDYDDNLLNGNAYDSTDYSGFFQCIQYYLPYEKELKYILKFKPRLLSIVEQYLREIKLVNGCEHIATVHVRRGDNSNDNGKYQVLLSPQYYEEIINKISINKTKILLISDDIPWCKDNIKNENIIFCDISDRYSEFAPHILDFCTLSCGDKIVMSSSSYSWWAAFLSNTDEIYCPSRWFGSEYSNFHEENVRHPKWITLQYQGLP